jgi:hypothetical protein
MIAGSLALDEFSLLTVETLCLMIERRRNEGH